MARIVTIVGLSLLMAVSALAGVSPEKRTALVIGNSAYESSPLKNPVNDAADIAAALKKLGFDVTLKTDVSQGFQQNQRQPQGFGPPPPRR